MAVLQLHGIACQRRRARTGSRYSRSGDRSNGAVIASGNQEHRPRGTPVGGTVIYDTAGTTIALDAARNDPECKTLTINASSAITMTSPHVTVKSADFKSSA